MIFYEFLHFSQNSEPLHTKNDSTREITDEVRTRKMIKYAQKKLDLKTDRKKMALALKCSINKKSTMFGQTLWNFVKLILAWVGQIGKVSSKLDKNCGFFINRQFLSQCHFFRSVSTMLYIKISKIRSYAKKKLDGNCDDETNWT